LEKDFIAVFPILADVVKVKKGSGSTAHWLFDLIPAEWMAETLLYTVDHPS